MIYVSSSCLKYSKISDCVKALADYGICNIELSGGTDYYSDILSDLLLLKKEYNLNYLVHNYFPPPEEPFILNLASLDDRIWMKSVDFMKKSINMAVALGSPVYGLHAGFFVNPSVNEIGKVFNKRDLFNQELAVKRFIEGYKIIENYCQNKLKLYVENNVLSYRNYKEYGTNPFMLTTFDEYKVMRDLFDFNLLFDLAHFKVSANSLKLNLVNETAKFMEVSDYIHISDNDGFADQNLLPRLDTFIYKCLKEAVLCNKLVTLEIYADIHSLSKFYRELNKSC